MEREYIKLKPFRDKTADGEEFTMWYNSVDLPKIGVKVETDSTSRVYTGVEALETTSSNISRQGNAHLKIHFYGFNITSKNGLNWSDTDNKGVGGGNEIPIPKLFEVEDNLPLAYADLKRYVGKYFNYEKICNSLYQMFELETEASFYFSLESDDNLINLGAFNYTTAYSQCKGGVIGFSDSLNLDTVEIVNFGVSKMLHLEENSTISYPGIIYCMGANDIICCVPEIVFDYVED